MKTKLFENVGSNPKAIFKRSSRIDGTEKKKMGNHVFLHAFAMTQLKGILRKNPMQTAED